MNKAVILGQFDHSKIRNLILNCKSPMFMTECDLTMVHWPLIDGEISQYSHPISDDEKEWVICVDGHQEEILKFLQ